MNMEFVEMVKAEAAKAEAEGLITAEEAAPYIAYAEAGQEREAQGLFLLILTRLDEALYE
jgi:hypothetical protein